MCVCLFHVIAYSFFFLICPGSNCAPGRISSGGTGCGHGRTCAASCLGRVMGSTRGSLVQACVVCGVFVMAGGDGVCLVFSFDGVFFFFLICPGSHLSPGRILSGGTGCGHGRTCAASCLGRVMGSTRGSLVQACVVCGVFVMAGGEGVCLILSR